MAIAGTRKPNVSMKKHELYAPEKLTRTFEITGQTSVVNKITALLATMKVLGDWGSSRTFSFDWDGDGHENFKMEVGSVDIGEYFDPCQFVDDESMCKEHEDKGNESYIGAESMKRIDKLIEAVEKGADPGFLVNRETEKSETRLPAPCKTALMDAGFKQVSVSPDGHKSNFVRGNQEIVLFDDGSYWAYEGGKILNPPTGSFEGERDCYDLLKDGWPDIIFY